MTTLHITLTNEDKGYQFAQFSEDLEDEYTSGEIYRMLQREYGRCTSKIYADTSNGVQTRGWYFESRQRYEDTNQHYLRGAWCIVVRDDN